MGVRWVKDHVFVPLYRAYQRWDRDGGGQMAAATGYYMALSFFPLLLVLLAVLGLLLRFTNWGRNAEEQLLTIIAEYSDPTLAEQVRNAISSVEINATVSGPIGLLTLLFAAMAIFAQLDRAFDRIWSLPEAPRRGVLATLRTILLDRLRAFLMLLVMGVLAVAAFVLNMTLSTLAAYSGPLRLSVDQTPYKGYDTGAYLHAFRKLAADSYIFLQDSACPKEPGWTETFTSRLTYGVGCVPWLTFPLQWDEEGQLEFIRQQYRTDRVPPLGVFGPMFAASRESLLKLDQMKLLDAIPSTKVEQQAMERGWPLAFFLGGFGIRPIHTMFSERKLRAGEYGVLSKRLPKRS